MDNDTTVPVKRCVECGEDFPATTEYFHIDKRGRYGLRSTCKTCRRESTRIYRLQHTEIIREYKRKYRLQNVEREREYQRAYHAANKEHRNEYSRAHMRSYYMENIDWYHSHRNEYQRKYRSKNAKYVRERDRKYKRNPKGRARNVVIQHNRRARLRDLPDTLTAVQSQFATEYWNGCCAYCGRQFYDLFNERALALDHYIPLSCPDCPGTVASNMLPACHGVDGCNNSKGNRDPDEWLEDRFGKRKARAILARIEAYFEVVRMKFLRDEARRDVLRGRQDGD